MGILREKEKPRSARAVRNTLVTVTAAVPNRLVTLSDRRLDMIVPPLITMDIMPI